MGYDMLMPFEKRTSEKNTIKIQVKIKLELRKAGIQRQIDILSNRDTLSLKSLSWEFRLCLFILAHNSSVTYRFFNFKIFLAV